MTIYTQLEPEEFLIETYLGGIERLQGKLGHSCLLATAWEDSSKKHFSKGLDQLEYQNRWVPVQVPGAHAADS